MTHLLKFTVTKHHLKLLQHQEVTWDIDGEFGAPCIDPKRPYGNSDIPSDIRDILGEPYEDRDDLSEEQIERYTQLHAETETALQICLARQKFATGTFTRKHPYSRKWKKE